MSEPKASESGGSATGGGTPTKRGSMSEPKASDALDKFLTFQREVNRLFRRIFEEGSNPRPLDGEGGTARANVVERGSDLLVEVETPGVPRESLTLEVSRDLIVVEGERPARRTGPEPVRFHALERESGRFRRILEIPCPVDARGIRAHYARGVVTITLPKIEVDRRGERRRVPIEGPSGEAGGRSGPVNPATPAASRPRRPRR